MEGGPFLLEVGGRPPLVEPVPASYPLRQVPLGGDDICETYICHGLVIHQDFSNFWHGKLCGSQASEIFYCVTAPA